MADRDFNYPPTPKVDFGGATPSGSFTLRDTMAMHALGAMPLEISAITEDELIDMLTYRAKIAYLQADIMLAERATTMGYKKKKG